MSPFPPEITYTFTGSKKAEIQQAWDQENTQVRQKDGKSLDQLADEYPGLDLKNRAQTMFEHICFEFDKRVAYGQYVEDFLDTYGLSGNGVSASEMEKKNQASAITAQIDTALGEYVLDQMRELRPKMLHNTNDADIFIGKVICSAQNAYLKVTGRRPSIMGKEQTALG